MTRSAGLTKIWLDDGGELAYPIYRIPSGFAPAVEGFAMEKTLLFRLFRVGRIPRELRAELEAEGVVVADEGIGGWSVLRNFRGPGQYSLYRVRSFTGWLAITKRRVMAYAYRVPRVGVPLDDPRLGALHVAVPDARHLVLSFEAEVFRPDCHGEVELRYRTSSARAFYEALVSAGATPVEAREPAGRTDVV